MYTESQIGEIVSDWWLNVAQNSHTDADIHRIRLEAEYPFLKSAEFISMFCSSGNRSELAAKVQKAIAGGAGK